MDNILLKKTKELFQLKEIEENFSLENLKICQNQQSHILKYKYYLAYEDFREQRKKLRMSGEIVRFKIYRLLN